MKNVGIDDKLVLVGGNIPRQDVETLLNYGVAGVFPIGAKLDDIVTFIQNKVREGNEKIES